MREDGWAEMLSSYLEASRTMPFIWGKNDCALWAATFVDSITGSQWTDVWRGKYKTEAGALKCMRSRGFKDCSSIADASLQIKPVPMAARGDVVLHPCGSLGLCDGRLSYFLMAENGLCSIQTTECLKAWAV